MKCDLFDDTSVMPRAGDGCDCASWGGTTAADAQLGCENHGVNSFEQQNMSTIVERLSQFEARQIFTVT
jgi:hypothetical protein